MISRILTCATVVAALFASQTASAGPDQVSILLGSEHVGATRSFEEVNPGVFLTWTEAALQNRADISVGVFRNSYGDGSLAVSMAWPLYRQQNVSLDLFGAIAWYPGNGDQFRHAIGDIVPIGGIQGRFGNVFFQAIPAGGDGVDATLTFGLTFPLN